MRQGSRFMECDGVVASPSSRDAYVCACMRVTHAELLEAVECHNICSLADLRSHAWPKTKTPTRPERS